MAANTHSNANETRDTLYDFRKTHVPRVRQPPGGGPAKSAKSAGKASARPDEPAKKTPAKSAKPVTTSATLAKSTGKK